MKKLKTNKFVFKIYTETLGGDLNLKEKRANQNYFTDIYNLQCKKC